MSFLKTLLAVVAGFVLAAVLYHPQSARALNNIRLTEIKPGLNSYVLGDRIIGFGCTQDACYIASE
jgi:hypothetical protein